VNLLHLREMYFVLISQRNPQNQIQESTVLGGHLIYLAVTLDCELKDYSLLLNTLWTGDADLGLYITTVQDG